jgi:cytochrome c-type biogenesis protein CcmE
MGAIRVKSRHKKLLAIVVLLAVLGIVVMLVLNAFRSNLVFFFSPTEVVEGRAPQDRAFRIGGLVEMGTLQRDADGLTIRFRVTDTAHSTQVVYQGVVPDLFKEGKGAVAEGRMNPDGTFTATQVLAKHDENYMPPEAASAIEQAQKAKATLKD